MDEPTTNENVAEVTAPKVTAATENVTNDHNTIDPACVTPELIGAVFMYGYLNSIKALRIEVIVEYLRIFYELETGNKMKSETINVFLESNDYMEFINLLESDDYCYFITDENNNKIFRLEVIGGMVAASLMYGGRNTKSDDTKRITAEMFVNAASVLVYGFNNKIISPEDLKNLVSSKQIVDYQEKLTKKINSIE